MSERTLLGHPAGLFVLFISEACERFSYYGMRALIALYLIEHFIFQDSTAFGVVAAYGSLVYLMPIIGGFLADRYIGFRKAIIFGGILLCCGHLLMAYEGEAAQVIDNVVQRDGVAMNVMFLALSFIIVGVGFLKPSISNIVGQLYVPNDPRRDQGFTLFYMGINLGAISSILICGWLGKAFGWSYGFGLAGIVMLLGLGSFLLGRPLFGQAGEPNSPERLDHRVLGIRTEVWIYTLCVPFIIACWFLIQYRSLLGSLLGIVSAVAILGIVVYSLARTERVQRHRLLVVLYLIVVSVVFWALFEQAGSSIKLFADRNVDLGFLFWELSAAQIDFFNPLFVIVLAPVFALLWRFLSKYNKDPSTPYKFALAILLAGLSFFVMAWGTTVANSDALVAIGWVILGFLLITMGELCLSPIGLSMVTRYSAKEIMGVLMGVWFLASSVASFVSGKLALLAAVDYELGEATVASDTLPVYQDAFLTFGLIGTGTAVVLLLLCPIASRLLHTNAPHEEETSG